MDSKEALEVLRREVEDKVVGDRHIVVLDRGWIFVGNLSEDDGIYTLRHAFNSRKWERGGFGGLTKSATDSGAVMDECAPIGFRGDAMVLWVAIPESWK